MREPDSTGTDGPAAAGRRAPFDLPRPVWLLGWVSLATDAASEAIYALLPVFLTQVLGAGAIAVGVVEGAAEAANSILKIVAGRMADRFGGRRRFVLFGYSLSSAARPIIALASSWWQVFAIRVLDRVGKGVRGSPRDAMLAAWAAPAARGRVYGFHQGMDSFGAVVGPALATLFLVLRPGQYRTLFALTIVPGAMAVLLIFFVPESDARARSVQAAGPEPASGAALPRRFWLFTAVLGVFMLGNSTDAFLLLRLADASGGARYVPLMWAGVNLVRSVVSVVGGDWSDRIGRRAVIATGWLVYAIVYAGFALSRSLTALLAWFMVYGFYYGFAEGTEKALVADLAPAAARGTAFGIYNATTGLGALAASLVFGVLWSQFGAPLAFGVGAALALAATVLLFFVVSGSPIRPGKRR